MNDKSHFAKWLRVGEGSDTVFEFFTLKAVQDLLEAERIRREADDYRR